MYFEYETQIINNESYIVSINDIFQILEFHHIKFIGAYGSIFDDMDEVECDICQHCLRK